MPERVLIVGLGSIGSRHARIVRELLPKAQIAVLRHRGCDHMPTDCIDQCFTSRDDAMQFRPQVAVIANPATHHLQVALPLAEAGVHLLIEKPVQRRFGETAGVGVPDDLSSGQANPQRSGFEGDGTQARAEVQANSRSAA